jgi:hypothetical protein
MEREKLRMRRSLSGKWLRKKGSLEWEPVFIYRGRASHWLVVKFSL